MNKWFPWTYQFESMMKHSPIQAKWKIQEEWLKVSWLEYLSFVFLVSLCGKMINGPHRLFCFLVAALKCQNTGITTFYNYWWLAIHSIFWKLSSFFVFLFIPFLLCLGPFHLLYFTIFLLSFLYNQSITVRHTLWQL